MVLLGILGLLKRKKPNLKFTSKQNKMIKSFRWIVEQGFCFLDKARRLVVNYEKTAKMHEGFVKLQFIPLKLNQMAR